MPGRSADFFHRVPGAGPMRALDDGGFGRGARFRAATLSCPLTTVGVAHTEALTECLRGLGATILTAVAAARLAAAPAVPQAAACRQDLRRLRQRRNRRVTQTLTDAEVIASRIRLIN